MAATVAAFFGGRPTARRLFDAVNDAVSAAGPCRLRITKSQIAFQRRRAFAWAWTPDRWLAGDRLAPLVLSLAFPRRIRSKRWKEVVQPRAGWFMHHLELHEAAEVDDEVRRWLAEAWEAAV